MAGILKDSNQSTSAPAKLANPQLQQIEAGIEAKVPPVLKQKYLSIVVAGMRVMFDKSTTQYMQQHVANATDIVQTISTDIPKLLVLIFHESKLDKSPDQNQQAQFIGAAMLAGRTLMCQALDFAEKTGKLQVNKQIIDQCTAALNVAMPEAFGITKEMIAKHLGVKGAAPAASAAPTAPATAPVVPPTAAAPATPSGV